MSNVVNLFGNIGEVKQSKSKGQQYLSNILAELREELKHKKDIILHPQDIRLNRDGLLVTRGSDKASHLTDWSLGQLASKTTVPVRYLRNCPPELQAVNVNYWLNLFDREKDNSWLFRTVEGDSQNIVRGILSEKYSPFDDHEILSILEDFFGGEEANIDIKYWYRDDTGFHLRIIFDDLTTTVGTTIDGKPDVHKVGIHIENSEVGKKSIKITPLIYRLVCSNGLMGWVRNNDMEIFTQRHIYLKPHEMYGRVAEAIGNALKVGDSVIEKLVQAKETPVTNPLDVIKQLAEKHKYSKEFTEKVQGAFMEEQKDSAFYVVQAFTRACRDLSADARVEKENDASRMLDELLKNWVVA